ncbi:MAG: WYL domain-containing protein [Oscillospiraceae bacterium]|nr:WYL domain-containing protein [Oscillospiraceae bacterium]
MQSSRFITTKKSGELIQKLSGLTSRHQAKGLRRQVFTAERPKAINEGVYYNIDTIHLAIHDGFQINFQYFDYDLSKTRAYRRDGEQYQLTPLALCWSDDNYYLICYNAKYDALNHYRVDRMSAVSLCAEKADKIDNSRFDVSEHVQRLFGMFGGEVVRARLWFDQSLINTVLDRFGIEVPLHKSGAGFEVTVDISTSPVFLGWIAQFGGKAEILAPDSLRKSMRTMIRELGERYA